MGSPLMSRYAARAAVLLCASFSAISIPAASIWIEGEQPAKQDVTRHPFWYDQVKKSELSGGDWISNWNDTKAGALSYSFTVDKAGPYTFWLRANPTGAALSYQIDNGEAKDVSFAGAVDNRNVAGDGKIDLRFMAWIKVGKLDLSKGAHTVSFRMHSENNNHGAIDCFAFTDEPFVPQGASKPGEGGTIAQAVSEEGHWAFTVADDPYKADALMDLTSLNEKIAGEKGLIALSKDGNSFVRGDGEPIRFWGVVSGGSEMTPDDMEEHCRWLAKHGVNMVRLHRTICRSDEGAKITDVNEKEIDGIFRFIATAKKHGIYTTLSPFWAAATAPKSWGLEDYAGKPVWGVLFFNDKLKDAYKAWTKELYTRVNPYTGIALKDEPAVAIIQVQNEDGLLFWTINGLEKAQRRLFQEKFGQWVTRKYGSLDKAMAAWNGDKAKEDDLAAGRLELLNMWDLSSQSPPAYLTRLRLRDQTQFMGELQHSFYAEMQQHYRSLGCKQLVNSTNWRSADPLVLDDIERWSYTPNDVSAINFYTAGMHTGPNDGWRIDPGHRMRSDSVLKSPETFPMSLKQTVGHPMLITETSWTDPAEYQTEGPFMACAYQSLNGVDCTYWFAYGNPGFEQDNRYMFLNTNGHYSLHKWSGNTPQQAGMFPAFALAFRQGYIKAADQPAVYEERSLEDMWQRKLPIIAESGKFDPNRDEGAFAKSSSVKQEVDRLAFLVGPVQVKYGGDARNNKVVDLSKYINNTTGKVKSLTGEIELDHKIGLCTINAPAIQGVSGFLKQGGGKFDFADVSLQSNNEYATIAAVSLDGKPLKQSGKVLVQIGTTARPTGWTTKKATFKIEGKEIEGEEIVATGNPPLQIADTLATITISNPGLTKATLLDANGYAVKSIETRRAEGGAGAGKLTITLPGNAMYVVLQ